MESRELFEEELRAVLVRYREGLVGLDGLSSQVSHLAGRILRLRTEELLEAMKFVNALEEINDAVLDDGRRVTPAEKVRVNEQLAKLETLLLGLSAISQDS